MAGSRGRGCELGARPPPPSAAAAAAPAAEEGVERKQMEDDELCPICYDTMSLEQDVTYCKRSANVTRPQHLPQCSILKRARLSTTQELREECAHKVHENVGG